MRLLRTFVAAPLALVVLVVGATIACGTGDDETPFFDPELPVVELNPDGIPYPTDHIGSEKRRGARPGNRFPNFVFRAYRNGRASGLESVPLAEYYDPGQARHKLLHLQVAATWCSICSSELSATMTIVEPAAKLGVQFLEVIISGKTVGKGPSLLEVERWIDRHGTTFPTAIDVEARRLGSVGVHPSMMPHDILIDTRTMEILDSSVGAPLDVGKYVLEGLRFVDENPPSY